jgi:hypothetical protein
MHEHTWFWSWTHRCLPLSRFYIQTYENHFCWTRTSLIGGWKMSVWIFFFRCVGTWISFFRFWLTKVNVAGGTSEPCFKFGSGRFEVLPFCCASKFGDTQETTWTRPKHNLEVLPEIKNLFICFLISGYIKFSPHCVNYFNACLVVWHWVDSGKRLIGFWYWRKQGRTLMSSLCYVFALNHWNVST